MCDCLPCAEEPCHDLQKKKDLTAAEGHVVLLEYLEERPLLLSRPGETLNSFIFACQPVNMSVATVLCDASLRVSQADFVWCLNAGMSTHITTYYRKEDPADTGHIKLLEGTSCFASRLHGLAKHFSPYACGKSFAA